MLPRVFFSLVCLFPVFVHVAEVARADDVRDLQTEAIETKKAAFGHWGWDRNNYMAPID
jgi:hypothetical protein